MAAHQPADPDFAARVRASFARQGAMRLIGAAIIRVEPGICEIAVPYKDELAQQHGYFHGGIIGAVADSAGGYAAYTLMPQDASVLTVEYKINMLAPADGDSLIARGCVLRAGRTLVIARSDVMVVKSGQETLCATLLMTSMTMRGKADHPEHGKAHARARSPASSVSAAPARESHD